MFDALEYIERGVTKTLDLRAYAHGNTLAGVQRRRLAGVRLGDNRIMHWYLTERGTDALRRERERRGRA